MNNGPSPQRRQEHTFLLTDIEGSTRLWERHPEQMSAALARHDELLSRLVADHGGRLIRARGEGDSGFAVFSSPEDAGRCAVAVQRAFRSEPWPSPVTIRVRIAVHSGEAEHRGDDWYGPPVNRCARLRALAYGDQVLVSDAVRIAIEGTLPEGARLTDLGLHRLKDLERPERVWQLSHPDLPDRFPPLRSLDSTGHNLPVQPTSFVGRETDLRELEGTIAPGRLVTVVGPGGVGKTRLALQAAAASVDRYPDGVWFAGLASVSDAQLVPARVARDLSVREEPGRRPTDTLVDHLRGRSTLLLLDNCEHLADACAELVAVLLAEAPGLAVVATSREPLRVYGEVVLRIDPLAVPAAGAAPEDVMASESVRLLADRGRLADRSFRISEDNASSAGEICRRLDGMPLALELAAALLGLMDVDEVATGIHERLSLLTMGPRTVEARQQTLRATLDWSYDLLTPPLRRTFARLGVFAGRWTEEAASAVLDMAPGELAEALEALAARSLIAVDAEGGRFSMLQSLREYALERLAEAGEVDDLERRHLDWFDRFASEARIHVGGPDESDWYRRLDGAQADLFAALDRSVTLDVERGVSMCDALLTWWDSRCLFQEGRHLVSRLLDADPGPAARAQGLTALGHLAFRQSDNTAAENALRQALALATESADSGYAARIAYRLGTVLHERRVFEEAESLYERALEEGRRSGNGELVVATLNVLGQLARDRGEYGKARLLFEETLALAEADGNERAQAMAIGHLAYVADRAGDHGSARMLFEREAQLYERLGNRWGQGWSAAKLGMHYLDCREVDAADGHLKRADDIAEEIGIPALASYAAFGLARVARMRGDLDSGERLAKRCRELAEESAVPMYVPYAIALLGSIAGDRGELATALELTAEAMLCADRSDDRQGLAAAVEARAEALMGHDDERAVVLLGVVRALREEIGIAAAHDESAVENLRGRMGSSRFESLYERGRGSGSAEVDEILTRHYRPVS